MIIRHGEAVSNAEDLVAGHRGCRGLTRGASPAGPGALSERIGRTGELEGATALYSSVLPRAIETAELLRPALGEIPYSNDARFVSATRARPTG